MLRFWMAIALAPLALGARTLEPRKSAIDVAPIGEGQDYMYGGEKGKTPEDEASLDIMQRFTEKSQRLADEYARAWKLKQERLREEAEQKRRPVEPARKEPPEKKPEPRKEEPRRDPPRERPGERPADGKKGGAPPIREMPDSVRLAHEKLSRRLLFFRESDAFRDLKRRAELSKQLMQEGTQRPLGEDYSRFRGNEVFSERSGRGVVPEPPPVVKVRDRSWEAELKKRKEKGVRIFVDPGELADVMARSEERALEMLEKMEGDLVAGRGDFFSVLRNLKRRVTAQLATGKLTAKLGYQKMPWSGYRERILALSLRNLMAMVEREGRVSEEVRRLGRFKRVLGYMRDAINDDVVLIGVPADREDPHTLLLDDLTHALASVWRDGQKPGCSLDPDPKNFAGKQKVRVFGVPKNSHFAKVMLDADYEMKKINFGLTSFDADPIPGFVSNFDLRLRQKEEDPQAAKKWTGARYWLTPMAPHQGDLMVDPGRQFILFQTRVQLLTEMQAVSNGALAGDGKMDPIDDQSTRIFTAHYEEIERRRVIFRQLHGLFDLVMLCQMLRENGIRSGLLNRIASRKTAPVSVADHYDGLTRTVTLKGGRVRWSISGGVMVYLKLRRQHYRDLERKEIARMEAAVLDALCGRAVNISDSRALQTVLRDRLRVEKFKRKADVMFEAGTRHAFKKEYAKAERCFTQALAYDPDSPEIYCQRAIVRYSQKRYREAIGDCDRAIRKEPDLWAGYRIRSWARRGMGDAEGARADWAKYRELIRKDEFLKSLLRDREREAR